MRCGPNLATAQKRFFFSLNTLQLKELEGFCERAHMHIYVSSSFALPHIANSANTQIINRLVSILNTVSLCMNGLNIILNSHKRSKCNARNW